MWDEDVNLYVNDGSQNFSYSLVGRLQQPTSVFANDLDGDGDLDIMSSSRYEYNIYWFENNGNNDFTTKEIKKINQNSITGKSDIFSIDIKLQRKKKKDNLNKI